MTEFIDKLEKWILRNPKAAKQIVQEMDGHAIFDPEVLDPMNEELKQEFVEVHESGKTHKSTIYVDGQPVQELEGVNGLKVLSRFKSALDVQTRTFIGRGFQAQADKEALIEELDDLIEN